MSFLYASDQFVFVISILRETANAHSMKGWKPYGTPLVSPISCDNVTTRGDVQSMVRTMLSPLLKLRELADLEANGISPAVEPSSDTLIEQVDSSESLPWKESNNAQSCGLVKLPLQLVDENNVCIDLSVGEDKPVKISSFSKSLLVFINWSKELLEKYDTSYLENLPEVCKNGPPTKKARTEPLSLYSCLEAFLLEEPLVSEPDMWLVFPPYIPFLLAPLLVYVSTQYMDQAVVYFTNRAN